MTLGYPKPTPRARQAKPLKARPHVIPRPVREETFNRDAWLCQWCRTAGGALDAHHRLPRGRGGKDHASVLVSVHRRCHDYIHLHPTEATSRGFLVSSADELAKGWLPPEDDVW